MPVPMMFAMTMEDAVTNFGDVRHGWIDNCIRVHD